MSPLLLVVLSTSLAAGLAVFGMFSLLSDLYLRDRSRVLRRVDDEFRKKQRDKVRRSLLFKDLTPQALESIRDGEEPTGVGPSFARLVEQSGLNITPGRLLLLMSAAALAVGLLAGLLRQSALVGLIGFVVGATLPYSYVAQKRRARINKLTSQLPDAFDLMARVVRAGQTTSQGLQAVAEEFEQPLAGEFSYCYEQQNLGLSPELALRDLARRVGILEVKVFVLGLLVQQQTGGNLAEVLDKLAAIIRERFKIKGRISALTGEGRLQAMVLLALPPLLLLMILIINPGYARVLLAHSYLLVGMFVAEGLGALWIRKIINFDY